MIASPELRSALEAAVSDAAGAFRLERATPAPGGCIHRSFILEGGGCKFFAKINDRSHFDTFAAEAEGLAALAAAGARVPAPLCRGEGGKEAFLVLEYLDLRRTGDHAALGRALAAMHSVHGDNYGWRRDNYIGATPQFNRQSASWSEFWSEARLAPQLALARKNGLGNGLVRKGERLAAARAPIAVPKVQSEGRRDQCKARRQHQQTGYGARRERRE